MIRQFTRITITSIRKPTKKNINSDLQWLGNSLGLFNERDKDKSCFRLFIELLKAVRKGEALNSDELAERLKLSRGTVIHHMHKLIDAGIVIVRDGRYILRTDNVEALIMQIRRDMNTMFEDLLAMAEEIDGALGLEKRH